MSAVLTTGAATGRSPTGLGQHDGDAGAAEGIAIHGNNGSHP